MFIIIASSVCLCIGMMFCFPHIERYRRSKGVGSFGILLVVCGVVLMTTFKWTEVAIKISGLEFKLAEAEKQSKKLDMYLAAANSELSKIAEARTRDQQNETLNAVVTELATAGAGTASYVISKDLKEALSKAGFSILPNSILPDHTMASGGDPNKTGGS